MLPIGFWSLASGLLDTLVWWFDILHMAALFDIDGQHRFEVVEKIADGRMGAVFRANQIGSEEFAKEVAIKVIEMQHLKDEYLFESIGNEINLMKTLKGTA